MNIGQTYRRRGMMAAAAAMIVAAAIGVVSVAGAAQDLTIFASDNGGTCFTTDVAVPCDGTVPSLTVQTGDTVTWDFRQQGTIHNAVSQNEVAADPNWTNFDSKWSNTTVAFTFTAPGRYEFVCQVHPGMTGTIVVEGAPVEGTPTPTATATPTATSTPTAAPTFAAPTPTPTVAPDAGDHRDTPAPGSGARDTSKPRVANVSAKRLKAGARLRFWLSEPATLTIKIKRKGAKAAGASAVVQSPAGTRAVTLRTKALKRGTYVVTFAPVDAMGNRGATVKRTLRVR